MSHYLTAAPRSGFDRWHGDSSDVLVIIVQQCLSLFNVMIIAPFVVIGIESQWGTSTCLWLILRWYNGNHSNKWPVVPQFVFYTEKDCFPTQGATKSFQLHTCSPNILLLTLPFTIIIYCICLHVLRRYLLYRHCSIKIHITNNTVQHNSIIVLLKELRALD